MASNIGLNAVRKILMEQLERLNDDVETCKTAEGIEREISRTKGMVSISEQLIDMGRLQVEAMKVAGEYNYKRADMPLLLESEK